MSRVLVLIFLSELCELWRGSRRFGEGTAWHLNG